MDEASVTVIWDALLEAIDFFQDAVRPLLNKCEKRLHFLDLINRLNWYKVTSQCHLGILVLVDTIEAAGQPDLLSGIPDAREEAEHESFNVLKFGVETTYIRCARS